ncbi:MAG: archaeosortase/exosortase family protein, partial [Verrucomicrobiota bacterium]
MDQESQTRRQVIRTVLSLAGVFLVLHLAQKTDVLSELTRPFTVAILRLFGLAVANTDDSLLIGRLAIPWSRDCAGLNVLGILWAMTIWANRREPRTGLYALRLLLAVPAAFAANLARILTLIAYRQVLYPSVESPQLHYFIGFLWLVPVVWFFCPRGGRGVGRYAAETIHLAAALSLLAPLIPAPGGSVVTLCTLLLLAGSRFVSGRPGPIRWRLAGWLAAALLIGETRMESLWLPWLLSCPAFTGWRASSRMGGLALLLGTIPLVAMHNLAACGILLAAGFGFWRRNRVPGQATDDSFTVGFDIPRRSPAWTCV